MPTFQVLPFAITVQSLSGQMDTLYLLCWRPSLIYFHWTLMFLLRCVYFVMVAEALSANGQPGQIIIYPCPVVNFVTNTISLSHFYKLLLLCLLNSLYRYSWWKWFRMIKLKGWKHLSGTNTRRSLMRPKRRMYVCTFNMCIKLDQYYQWFNYRWLLSWLNALHSMSEQRRPLLLLLLGRSSLSHTQAHAGGKIID